MTENEHPYWWYWFFPKPKPKPEPEKQKVFSAEDNLKLLSIRDLITSHEYISTLDYILHKKNKAIMYENGDKNKPYEIEVYLYGLGAKHNELEEYFDILVEVAYDPKQPVVNIVVTNKGDNAISVSCRGFEIGRTEQVNQAKIYKSDNKAVIYGKWLSFYIKDPVIP